MLPVRMNSIFYYLHSYGVDNWLPIPWKTLPCIAQTAMILGA